MMNVNAPLRLLDGNTNFENIMKKHHFLFSLVLVLSPILSPAQGPNWINDSEVKEVRIFQQGALVERKARIAVPAGLQEIVIDGLSPYADPRSITLKGTRDATILSVSFEQNYLKDQKKPKEVIALEQELDSLLTKQQKSKNRQFALSEVISLLQANKSIGGANSGVMADELEPMADYFLKRLLSLKEDQLEEQLKEKKLNDRISKIQQQLAQARQKHDQPVGNIVARLDVKAKTTVEFEFGYYVSGNVSWNSLYDLKAVSGLKKVELIHKARVSQNTGEDWKNVRLLLSTGNPAAGITLPQLNPWYLNFLQPYPGAVRSAVYQAAPSMAEGAAIKMEDKMEMNTLQVDVSQDQLTSNFEIKVPYSIPSDGKEYQVTVQQFSLDAAYRHQAVPKLDSDAFLTASITGWEQLSLTPGDAQLYMDGSYMGGTFLDPFNIRDTLQISFGRDKNVVIKRDKLQDLTGPKLFGSNKERTLSYEIIIKNARKDSVEMILVDQLPLTMQKDIVVKPDELGGAVYNNETGELKWIIKLAPSGTAKKRFSFKVIYPKDKPVQGL